MAYLFLDESGIHKQDGISCVALVFVEVVHLELLNKCVFDTEQKIGIDGFHWKDHSWRIRGMFLEEIKRNDFKIKAAIVDNPFKDFYYKDVLKEMVVENAMHTLVIDGKKPKRYRNQLKKSLRNKGLIFKKVITGNDRSFPALRLADLCAGVIRAYLENPNRNSEILYGKLQKKIISVIRIL